MTEERIKRFTEWEYRQWFTRDYYSKMHETNSDGGRVSIDKPPFESLELAPPKDWAQQITTLKQRVIELEDANRHLALINDRLQGDK